MEFKLFAAVTSVKVLHELRCSIHKKCPFGIVSYLFIYSR